MTGPDWERERALFDVARTSIPHPYTWPDAPGEASSVWQGEIASAGRAFAPVIGRYLAAHAFASWMAYQGNGLPSLVSYLRLVLAVLRTEIVRVCREEGATLDREGLTQGIRRADLLLFHLADRQLVATRLSRAIPAR